MTIWLSTSRRLKMKIVVDANILFSALLRKGLTHKLMFDERLTLYAPQFLQIELQKYRQELKERTNIGEKEFDKALQMLLAKLHFVPDEETALYRDAVYHLVNDKKDAPYLACALAINGDLWTQDKALNQNRVKTWNTTQLAKQLGLLPE